jgi:hypothetical protein
LFNAGGFRFINRADAGIRNLSAADNSTASARLVLASYVPGSCVEPQSRDHCKGVAVTRVDRDPSAATVLSKIAQLF